MKSHVCYSRGVTAKQEEFLCVLTENVKSNIIKTINCKDLSDACLFD